MKLVDVLQNMEYNRFSGHAGRTVTGFSLDSRSVRRGEVFFCLDGRRHRGVDFIPQAIRRGASAVVVEDRHEREARKCAGRIAVILVGNVMKAIRECARFWKSRFPVITVAVTGSNGKTTTKELIAAILAEKYEVLRNEKNFNNEIGVPLTLFRLNRRHQVLVIELGVSRPGEMARLGWMVRPDYAVVTNIGSSHLEFLKTEYGVAREKSRLIDFTSKAVFVGLDNRFRAMFRRPGVDRISVHRKLHRADFRFESAVSRGYDGWTVRFGGRRFGFPLYGEYNLDNLLMAAAVGRTLGVTPAAIGRAAAGFGYIDSRVNLLRGRHVLLVDEAYNANYSSLSRSLRFLGRTETGGPKAAAIGEMKELGRRSRFLHGLIGVELTRSKIDTILLTGRETQRIRRFYHGRGRIVWCPDAASLAKEALELRPAAGPALTLLVKGSRSNALDGLVDILSKKWRLK